MQGGKEGLKFDKRIQTVLLLLAMAVKAAAVPTPDSVIPKLKDSKYFRETFFHIVNRDEQTVPFEQNVAQSKYYVDQSDDDLILKARHLGFCLHPDTRILTSYFRWVKIKDVEKGQTLISVDELTPKGRGNGRKMRESVLIDKSIVYEPCVKLKMDTGGELIATKQHRFLSRVRGSVGSVWRETGDMRIGDVIRYVTSHWCEATMEDAWFSGMADGEGSLRAKKSGGAELSVAQNKGLVWDRMVSYADASGFSYRKEYDKREFSRFGNGYSQKTGQCGKIVFCRMNELFELIGKTRPTRFVGTKWWDGKDLPGKRSGKAWSKIVFIEELPTREMIDIQTSKATFIAEGFVSHNSSEIEGDFLFDCMSTPNTNAVTMAHTLDDTHVHMQRIKYYIKSMRNSSNPIEVPLEAENRIELYLPNQNSYYWIGTAGATGWGRGRQVTRFHGSEVAHWKDQAVLTAVLNARSKRAKTRLETTANGMEKFAELWFDAEDPAVNSPWKQHFFAWWMDPENVRPVQDKFSLTGEEGRIREVVRKLYKISLTDEQVNWWRWEKSRQVDKNLMPQEHPSYPREAFLSSGRHVFPLPKIEIMESRIKEPVMVGRLEDDEKEIRPVDDAEGPLT